MNQSILDYVLARLDERDETLAQIAEASGVPFSTLQRIASRQTSNPTVKHVQRLYDHFKREVAA